MNSQLKRGTLELCVLSILCRSDCYGYELVNRISECMQITEGTIYPLMKRLKDNGMDRFLHSGIAGGTTQEIL